MEGWIKVHRKIIESAVFDNPGLLKTWLWSLCKATYKERETIIGRQTVTLQPGQFIFGRKSAGMELNINERTVYDYMKILEKLGCVRLNPNNKYTLVTVENWGLYQAAEEEPQQQTNNKRTADAHDTDTTATANRHKQECKELKESKKSNKEKNNFNYPPKGGSSGLNSLSYEEAEEVGVEVSEKRGFPAELQEAFLRWIKHKQTTEAGFKNFHSIDKVGATIESNSRDAWKDEYNMEKCNKIKSMIDYCISKKSKSLCWSMLYEFR